MPYKFNVFTGTLDWVNPSSGTGGITPWNSFTGVGGNTVTFSVAFQPTDVNSDGTIFFNQNGYTYNAIAGTITFINPPQQFAGYR